MEYAKAAQNAGYQNQVGASNALNQPKELGVLQRVEGMRVGLQVLRSRFEGFSDRLDGNAGHVSDQKGNIAPVSVSLGGTISDAENELRICLAMIDALNDRF